MKNNRTPNYYLIVAFTLLILGGLFAFLFLSTFYVTETPTGVNFNLQGEANEVKKVREDVLALIKKSNFSTIYFSNSSGQFESLKVGVSVDSEPNEITIFVLSNVKRANDWQIMAADIQKILTASILKVNRVSIQRDSSVYNCYKECDFGVSFPVDFDYLNKNQLSLKKE